MLIYNFKNYDEFKEQFGMQQHNNGTKSRKNKMLLQLFKNRELLRDALNNASGARHILTLDNMVAVKNYYIRYFRSATDGNVCRFERDTCGGFNYWYSPDYRTDEYNGVCEDGDAGSIRYVNMESGRVYKMKAGRFFRHLIDEGIKRAGRKYCTDQIINWLCEDFTTQWRGYVSGIVSKDLELHVDDDFSSIYDGDRCKGDFGSCMTDDGYYTYYEDAVDCSAAYLTNEDDEIVARCVIFNDVTDENGNTLRLAERQYSSESEIALKHILVNRLIEGGYIDGYKQIGAGCSDTRLFVSNSGEDWSTKRFRVDCNLSYGDTVSYQDSFRYLSMECGIAYNWGGANYDVELDITDGVIEGAYDEYHECYCAEVRSVYYHGIWISCDIDDLDDFVHVSGEGYCHTDDCVQCDRCGEWVLMDNSIYSEITEESYCDSDCLCLAEDSYKESYWTYSEYDDEYFENSEDVTSYRTECGSEMTISVSSLELLVSDGSIEVNGDGEYIMIAA